MCFGIQLESSQQESSTHEFKNNYWSTLPIWALALPTRGWHIKTHSWIQKQLLEYPAYLGTCITHKGLARVLDDAEQACVLNNAEQVYRKNYVYTSTSL